MFGSGIERHVEETGSFVESYCVQILLRCCFVMWING